MSEWVVLSRGQSPYRAPVLSVAQQQHAATCFRTWAEMGCPMPWQGFTADRLWPDWHQRRLYLLEAKDG